MSYLWLFPFGKGGPDIERKTQLKGIRGYARYLLQLIDQKFTETIKFYISNVVQKRDISYHTNQHVK